MEIRHVRQMERKRRQFISIFSLALVLLSLSLFWHVGLAHPGQLSLADILIGLRSKKVSLADRNKLLADAVRERGITFALTPEIEKELESTGAEKPLIEAIRQKSPIAKVVPSPRPTPLPLPSPTIAPAATPTPPGFAFYENRANAKFVSGEYDPAIADYTKSIELNPTNTSAYLSRATSYFNSKNYEKSIPDYDKVIELRPTDATAYARRAGAQTKLGNWQNSIDDYKKALSLDPGNDAAKAALEAAQLELAKSLPPEKIVAPPVAAEPAKIPEFVEIGQLNDLAIKLITPLYPQTAQKMGVQGRVVVQNTLDSDGGVIKAKATEGASALRAASEFAAVRSKFRPAKVADKPVKAIGYIVYNFKPN